MRWLCVVGGVMVLAVGAWYFGKSNSVAVTPVAQAPTKAQEATPEAPTSVRQDLPPLKVIEVIDLTRGYEPAPEESSTLPQGFTTANLLVPPSREERMPSAHGDRWEPIGVAPREVKTETLAIPPREITTPNASFLFGR